MHSRLITYFEPNANKMTNKSERDLRWQQAYAEQVRLRDETIAQLQRYDDYKGAKMKRRLLKTNPGALQSLLKYKNLKAKHNKPA